MLTAPQGFGTQHLHICYIQWILAAPGSLARKASPVWTLGASHCRVRADLLCTLQENGKGMAKLPGMIQQQKGFRKGNVPAPSTALAEVTGTETSSLLTARWHSLLQTIPFPKLGSKEHTGFHCSGADRPPFFEIIPVPGFDIPGFKHKQPSSRFHPDKDSHHIGSAASAVLALPARLTPGQFWHTGVRSR